MREQEREGRERKREEERKAELSVITADSKVGSRSQSEVLTV